MVVRRAVALAVPVAVGLVASSLLALSDPAQATTPACGNSSLSVSATPAQGATGHGSFVLLFKNTSAATCTVYGYPGLDALNSSGHAIAHATRTLSGFAGGSPSGIHTVTVAPSHFASATVEWMNFNPVTSGPCTFSASVAATPANTSHTVQLNRQVSVCALQVHPTVAGFSGNG